MRSLLSWTLLNRSWAREPLLSWTDSRPNSRPCWNNSWTKLVSSQPWIWGCAQGSQKNGRHFLCVVIGGMGFKNLSPYEWQGHGVGRYSYYCFKLRIVSEDRFCGIKSIYSTQVRQCTLEMAKTCQNWSEFTSGRANHVKTGLKFKSGRICRGKTDPWRICDQKWRNGGGTLRYSFWWTKFGFIKIVREDQRQQRIAQGSNTFWNIPFCVLATTRTCWH